MSPKELALAMSALTVDIKDEPIRIATITYASAILIAAAAASSNNPIVLIAEVNRVIQEQLVAMTDIQQVSNLN